MNPKFNMTNYEKTYAEFTWEVPEKFNFARDVVDKWAPQTVVLKEVIYELWPGAEEITAKSLLWMDTSSRGGASPADN